MRSGIHVETLPARTDWPDCGVVAQVKDRPLVELVDLPAFGRPSRLVWHKRRWRCPEMNCPTGSWTVGYEARLLAVEVRAAHEVWKTSAAWHWCREENGVVFLSTGPAIGHVQACLRDSRPHVAGREGPRAQNRPEPPHRAAGKPERAPQSTGRRGAERGGRGTATSWRSMTTSTARTSLSR